MRSISNRDFLQAFGLAVAALAASAALLIPGYLMLVPVLHPEFRPYIEGERAEPIAISGNRFRPVVSGDSSVDGSAVIISELAEVSPEDHAVLVHRRLFRADQFPFFRYHIEGRNPALQVMLFWQRADAPGVNHFAKLDYSGEGPRLHNLLRHEEWSGTITELAIGFFGDLRGETVKLHGVELEPYSHGGLFRVICNEWTAFSPWTQSSINVYRAVPHGALVSLVPLVGIWLATSIALFLLWRRVIGAHSRPSRSWLPAVIAMGLAWVALDALWLQQLLRQNAETRHLFAGKTLHEKKLADWDGEYYAASSWIKNSWVSETDELIILHQEDRIALAQRMRFHLLPELKAMEIRPFTRHWLERAGQNFDYVIVMFAPGTSPNSLENTHKFFAGAHTGHWRLVGVMGPVAMYATDRAKKQDDI